MRILPRYFLRLFLPIFGLCLGIFIGVLLMNYFLRLFNLAVMKGISLLWIADCFARLLPFFLSLAIPMAYLVALLMTLGQLSERGEIMALRASGFSFGEMTWPFLATGALLSALLLYVNHKASPEGFHSFRKRQAQAAEQIGRVDLEAGKFIPLGPWRLYAREMDGENGAPGESALRGVYLVRANRHQPLRIEARRGRLEIEKGLGASLELEEGGLQLPNPDPETLTLAGFSRYRMFVPLQSVSNIPRTPDMQEMPSSRLKQKIKDPLTSPTHRAEYAVEVAVRSAAALSPFVFFWIAAPLGLQMSRTGRARGFALSLAILFAFYGLLALGMGLGRRAPSLSSAAPWLADVAGLLAGLALTRRVRAQ